MKLKSYFSIIVIFGLTLSNGIQGELSPEQLLMIEQLPPDQRSNIMEKMESASTLTTEIEEKFEEGTSMSLKPELKDLEDSEDYCPECIYGYNFFQYSPTTFAPVDTTPVTPSYVLGPGDQIIVNFYGSEEREVETFIYREGKAVLPFIGPINF